MTVEKLRNKWLKVLKRNHITKGMLKAYEKDLKIYRDLLDRGEKGYNLEY